MDPDEQTEAIHQAIQNVLGGFATRWILVADITDHEGSALRTLTASDMAMWDSLGLLGFAKRMIDLDVEVAYHALDDDEGGY